MWTLGLGVGKQEQAGPLSWLPGRAPVAGPLPWLELTHPFLSEANRALQTGSEEKVSDICDPWSQLIQRI